MKNFILNSNKGETLIIPVLLTAITLSALVSVAKLDKKDFEKNTNSEFISASDLDTLYKETLNLKMNKIKDAFNKDDRLNKLPLEEIYVCVSVSDGVSQAIVDYSCDKEFDKAFEELRSSISDIISSKHLYPQWLKVDVIDSISVNTSFSRLKLLVYEEYPDTFNKGIMFEEGGETVCLMASELNANSILNYKYGAFNNNNLKDYLYLRDGKRIEKLPENYKLFTTISYFCDDSGVYPISKNKIGAEKRDIDELSSEEAERIINLASDYLIKQVQSDGQFIYGYYAANDEQILGHNSIRQSGTLWALIKCYDENSKNSKECKDAIDKAIGYLIRNISRKSDDIYHLSYTEDKICLGMDGLSLIALSEYTDKFDDTYLDVCKKIGNGIIDLQQEDGHFIHIIKDETYETYKEFSTVFYDGEAILGLCKLYNVSKDIKYLNAAQKAFDYCIDHDYLKYKDHWMEYCSNEITKFINDEEYYTFGLKNITQELEKIKNNDYTSHTNFEQLMQGYELYKRIIDNDIKVDYLKEFPASDFIETIKYRSTYQLNSFCYPEFVMYLTKPYKYLGAFYIRGDSYRIRIDDVQHSMIGLYYYSENF